jgi:hypothetical protein
MGRDREHGLGHGGGDDGRGEGGKAVEAESSFCATLVVALWIAGGSCYPCGACIIGFIATLSFLRWKGRKGKLQRPDCELPGRRSELSTTPAHSRHALISRGGRRRVEQRGTICSSSSFDTWADSCPLERGNQPRVEAANPSRWSVALSLPSFQPGQAKLMTIVPACYRRRPDRIPCAYPMRDSFRRGEKEEDRPTPTLPPLRPLI